MSTVPAWQAETRMSGMRSLLAERAAVLLRRIWHGMGRAWAQQRRRQAAGRTSAGTGGLSALLGRALTGRSAGGRMLAVEERLALGPKQHLYVIRCGEQRLLLASAAEGSLQWMALPEDLVENANPCDNTQLERSGTGAAGKRRMAKALAGEKSPARRAVRKAGSEGAR
jgi:hypothetical protein